MQHTISLPKTNNRLWLERKRHGLEQKQVASLLRLSREQISRFEKGLRLPNLVTALGLQIIYGVSARVLFAPLYEEIKEEIARRIAQSPALSRLYSSPSEADSTFGEPCPFVELMHRTSLTEEDKQLLRSHISYFTARLPFL
jgi:transcriptional regulator with XRE-family HTH domain